MSATIKTPSEIATMKKAGTILGEVLTEVMANVVPGVTELEIDKLAEKLILEKGGEVGFKKVYGYKYATCISVNEEVVHGIPGKRILKAGDVVCVDCGVFLDGFHTDMAETIIVGGNSASTPQKTLFLEIGKKALVAGISQAKVGNHVGHISKVIQDIVEGQGGYSIVTSLVGHGVGRDLHEAPEIPGFLKGKIEKTPRLQQNMTIAVEVIYNMGKADVVYEGTDDWTIISKDGSLSAVFERTILITESEPVVLTPGFGV